MTKVRRDYVQRLREDNGGRLPMFAWPGGYSMIYWFEQGGYVYPLCGECAEEQLTKGDDARLVDIETGDWYEEDLPCEECGIQLAFYFEEGDQR